MFAPNTIHAIIGSAYINNHNGLECGCIFSPNTSLEWEVFETSQRNDERLFRVNDPVSFHFEENCSLKIARPLKKMR